MSFWNGRCGEFERRVVIFYSFSQVYVRSVFRVVCVVVVALFVKNCEILAP